MRTLRFQSRLATPAAEVWAAVSTMQGVNDELMPLLRMTHPPDVQRLDDARLRTGQTHFHSWMLAGGLLPVDRHALGFDAIHPGQGFDERSSSWLQRVWLHQRRVQPDGAEGCVVTDELAFEPRLRAVGALVEPIVRHVFEHRHRRLRARFGESRA